MIYAEDAVNKKWMQDHGVESDAGVSQGDGISSVKGCVGDRLVTLCGHGQGYAVFCALSANALLSLPPENVKTVVTDYLIDETALDQTISANRCIEIMEDILNA